MYVVSRKHLQVYLIMLTCWMNLKAIVGGGHKVTRDIERVRWKDAAEQEGRILFLQRSIKRHR